MADLQRRAALGISLALTGGLMISLDIPMIRLAQSDPWLVMLGRGLGLSLVLGIVLLFARGLTDTPKQPFRDRDWLEVGTLYGINIVLFSMAVFNTSTANLVFILAFNPMIAAILAWWLIGEKPSTVTWVAIFFTFAGVAIIVNDGLAGGTAIGDMLSLATAIGLAYALVRARQSGKDMSLSPALGGLVTCFFAVPMAFMYSNWPGSPGWLVANILVLVPIAGFTLSLAPRFIPAPQVAMFFVLETVLAPIWVWIIFSEVPSTQTLIGGLIVLSAIAGHSFWQLRYRPVIA